MQRLRTTKALSIIRALIWHETTAVEMKTLLSFIFFPFPRLPHKKDLIISKSRMVLSAWLHLLCVQYVLVCYLHIFRGCNISYLFSIFCWVWLLILIIVALSHILWVTWKYCISWSQKTIELLINENKYTPFHWNCFWARGNIEIRQGFHWVNEN